MICHLQSKPGNIFLYVLFLQTFKSRSSFIFPFFALFAIGFILDLAVPWLVKVAMFVGVYLIWHTLNKYVLCYIDATYFLRILLAHNYCATLYHTDVYL